MARTWSNVQLLAPKMYEAITFQFFSAIMIVVSLEILALTGTLETADDDSPIEVGEFTMPIHEFAGIPAPPMTRPTSSCVNAPFVEMIVALSDTAVVLVKVL